jgi:hypothetical protein
MSTRLPIVLSLIAVLLSLAGLFSAEKLSDTVVFLALVGFSLLFFVAFLGAELEKLLLARQMASVQLHKPVR